MAKFGGRRQAKCSEESLMGMTRPTHPSHTYHQLWLGQEDNEFWMVTVSFFLQLPNLSFFTAPIAWKIIFFLTAAIKYEKMDQIQKHQFCFFASGDLEAEIRFCFLNPGAESLQQVTITMNMFPHTKWQKQCFFLSQTSGNRCPALIWLHATDAAADEANSSLRFCIQSYSIFINHFPFSRYYFFTFLHNLFFVT